MGSTSTGIQVLHFYNFLLSDGVHFPHEVTAISNNEGFIYISNVMTFEQSKRQANRLMDRTQGKKLQRLQEGNPLNSHDFIKISQIGMTHYFSKRGATYPDDASFESIIAAEHKILNEKRVDVVPSKIEKSVSGKSDLADKPLFQNLVLPAMTPGILEDVQQVMSDYPDLIDQLDSGADITASGMIELIFALVGSIHPDDPNGWVLDYLDEFGNLKSDSND
jgi:hypothetical protein